MYVGDPVPVVVATLQVTLLNVTELLETVTVPEVLNEWVYVSAPHTSALTLRATNMTSRRRRDIDKVRNLREEECFLQGGVFAHKALDK